MSANEDLMQEHGLLNRILLVFEELIQRVNAGQNVNPKLIEILLKIVRIFFQDFHEKNEEKYVFPHLMNSEFKSDVLELINQHNMGRKLVDQIFEDLNKNVDLKIIILKIKSLSEMYHIHESRENTVIFHAFRKSIPKEEYQKAEKMLDDDEDLKFGPNAFERFLNIVVQLEKKLNIYELKNKTPII